MASSPNDEQTKRGAEEPGLLLHNNTYYSLKRAGLARFHTFNHFLLINVIRQAVKTSSNT